MIKIIQKHLKNRKGFTLVELIVVVAVLGILASIAVPRLSGFTQNAQDQAKATNEKLLEKAASFYLAENGNPATALTWDGGTENTDDTEWQDYLDEWPDNFDNTKHFEVVIGTDGSVAVSEEAND